MNEQDADVYAKVVVPRYSALFGRLLLARIPRRERAQVLDIGCGTGYPALEVLDKLGEGGRVIAVDPDPVLIEAARRRAGKDAGRRIFFKPESAESLSFGDEVFDLVVGNLALGAVSQPQAALVELHRVLEIGKPMILTEALTGTFQEFFDMFREVALKHDEDEIQERIERVFARYPSASTLKGMAEAAGFEDVRVETEDFWLPFESASDAFRDPAIRLINRSPWGWIAEDQYESLLERARSTLDTYFGGGPVSIRVAAGVLSARA